MSDFMSELRSFMDEVEIQELEINQEEGFRITSREQAGYYVRKIKDLQDQAAEVSGTAKAEIERLVGTIKAWEERELAKTNAAMAYFNGLLKDFAEQELKDSKSRSVKLPFGTLAFKKQAPKFIYDEEALEKFLKENAKDYLKEKTITEPNKIELKKAGSILNGQFVLNGKPVEGITIEEQEDKFEVK